MAEHIFLVAVHMTAPTREEAELFLSRRLQVIMGAGLEEWWIAEDDRRDGSDNDSAVFCHKGRQADASDFLFHHGLTGHYNMVDPKRRKP